MRFPVVASLATIWTTSRASPSTACSSDACLEVIAAVEPRVSALQDCVSVLRPTAIQSTSAMTAVAMSSASPDRNQPDATTLLAHMPNIPSWDDHMRELKDRHLDPVLHETGKSPSSTAAAVPAYASPCSSLEAYVSACSCLEPANVIYPTATRPASGPILPHNVVDLDVRSAKPGWQASHSSYGRAKIDAAGTHFSLSNATSRPSNTSDIPVIDTTCGRTTPHFQMQVSQPGGGLLDGWFARLSGSGVVFVPSNGEGKGPTRFSIEPTGHLCAVGRSGEHGNALVAAVNIPGRRWRQNVTVSSPISATPSARPSWRFPSLSFLSRRSSNSSLGFNSTNPLNGTNGTLVGTSAIWMLDGAVIRALGGEYEPVRCYRGGSGELSCEAGQMRNWFGCGLVLEMSSKGGAMVTADGLDCSAIGVEAI
ncbi:hypothetical protein VTK73DRAFT_4561 [Phialemonium thermophilum]|uniref:Uncharacterized protein n=1 Tax=Phialemonium thermophilum TaxID=223376 RepID=A0ABR3WSK5_9PEZI